MNPHMGLQMLLQPLLTSALKVCMVILANLLHHPPRKPSGTYRTGGLMGPQSRSGRFWGIEKFLVCAWNRKTICHLSGK